MYSKFPIQFLLSSLESLDKSQKPEKPFIIWRKKIKTYVCDSKTMQVKFKDASVLTHKYHDETTIFVQH